MAIVTKTSYTGQKNVSTLNGRVRIEEGKDRLIMFDGTVNRKILGYDESTGKEIEATSKPGEDVLEALAA